MTALMRGWELILNITPKSYRTLWQSIPNLTDILADLSRKDWDERATFTWGAILKKVGSESRKELYLEACARAFIFAVRHEQFKVSGLVVESFLPIYEVVVNSKPFPSDLYELFGYTTWDKGKSLRKRLINAFVYSDWYPGDLILSVPDTSVMRKIYSRLLKFKSGREYIKLILEDLSNREHDSRTSHALKEFRALTQDENFYESWD
jgi:hypothetical protein